jgi:hypothetical protein
MDSLITAAARAIAAVIPSARCSGSPLLHEASKAPIALECSAFAVDGRPDLRMIVYNPATPVDQRQIRSLIEGTPAIGVNAGHPPSLDLRR